MSMQDRCDDGAAHVGCAGVPGILHAWSGTLPRCGRTFTSSRARRSPPSGGSPGNKRGAPGEGLCLPPAPPAWCQGPRRTRLTHDRALARSPQARITGDRKHNVQCSASSVARDGGRTALCMCFLFPQKSTGATRRRRLRLKPFHVGRSAEVADASALPFPNLPTFSFVTRRKCFSLSQTIPETRALTALWKGPDGIPSPPGRRARSVPAPPPITHTWEGITHNPLLLPRNGEVIASSMMGMGRGVRLSPVHSPLDARWVGSLDAGYFASTSDPAPLIEAKWCGFVDALLSMGFTLERRLAFADERKCFLSPSGLTKPQLRARLLSDCGNK